MLAINYGVFVDSNAKKKEARVIKKNKLALKSSPQARNFSYLFIFFVRGFNPVFEFFYITILNSTQNNSYCLKSNSLLA